MRNVTGGLIALLALGCSKPADKPADATTGEAPAMGAEPAGAISLADVAGTWKVVGTVQGSDGQTVPYDIVATPDREGWTINFPGREPVPARVTAVEGDSIVVEAGPFESALRKGVQVSTRSVNRLVGGKLVGVTTARYDVTGPDTVSVLDFEGTRAP